MIPVEKPWSNVVMGEGQSHVLPCPAHKDEKTGDIMVAFELTDEEVEAVTKHKTILLRQSTYFKSMNPVLLWVEDEKGEAIKDDRIPD